MSTVIREATFTLCTAGAGTFLGLAAALLVMMGEG